VPHRARSTHPDPQHSLCLTSQFGSSGPRDIARHLANTTTQHLAGICPGPNNRPREIGTARLSRWCVETTVNRGVKVAPVTLVQPAPVSGSSPDFKGQTVTCAPRESHSRANFRCISAANLRFAHKHTSNTGPACHRKSNSQPNSTLASRRPGHSPRPEFSAVSRNLVARFTPGATGHFAEKLQTRRMSLFSPVFSQVKTEFSPGESRILKRVPESVNQLG